MYEAENELCCCTNEGKPRKKVLVLTVPARAGPGWGWLWTSSLVKPYRYRDFSQGPLHHLKFVLFCVSLSCHITLVSILFHSYFMLNICTGTRAVRKRQKKACRISMCRVRWNCGQGGSSTAQAGTVGPELNQNEGWVLNWVRHKDLFENEVVCIKKMYIFLLYFFFFWTKFSIMPW